MPTPSVFSAFVRRLDLSTLELFVSVCSTGSIAAAASRGGLAVSTLSKRISLLEEAAGCVVLERHARGVRPTAAGEALLRHARLLIAGAAHLHEEMLAFSQGRLGSVHIAASASAVELYLPVEIARFAAAHPDISIDLTQRTSTEVIQAVRDSRADFGLCGSGNGAEGLEHRPFRMDQLVLLVPPGHPLAAKVAVEFAQALDYEQIGLLGSSQVQTLLEGAAAQAGRSLRQRIRVASIGSMCRMVESGLGIAVMPRAMVALAARRRHTRVVSLRDDWARLQLFVVARRFDQLSGPAAMMLSHLDQTRKGRARP